MSEGYGVPDGDEGLFQRLLQERVHARPRDEVLLRTVVYLGGIVLSAFLIWHAWESQLSRAKFAHLFLGVSVALFYLVKILDKYKDEEIGAAEDAPVTGESQTQPDGGTVDASASNEGESFLSWSLRNKLDAAVMLATAVIILGTTAYVELNWERLLWDAPVQGINQTDVYVGFVIGAIMIDATRRAYGNVIAAVGVVSVLYALGGPYLPGVLGHTGMGINELSKNIAIGLTGTYSFLLGIGATWVAIFIVFAGIAKAYGLMDFVLGIGAEIGKVLRTGAVQIAVIASMIMGSITGSAAANTATTGSFTIPMIKDQGVRKDFACAIEAVASSGGQMLPPVMGVAAFLMADIVGVPYVSIIRSGIIPALLFYFSVMVAVHLVIHRHGWTTPSTGTFDKGMLWGGIHYVVPLGILLYTLVVLRFSPLAAGFYTILSIIPTALVKRLYDSGISLDSVLQYLVTTLDGFREGAVDIAPLMGMIGALGIILAMVNQTGLSGRLSSELLAMAGGVLVILLVITMITSILFGLGMPTPAAYIIVALLVASPLVEFGIQPITAHMFVFYFAMLSAITPPVAVAVAVGCRIAESNFMTSSYQALRIGAPGFVIPFAFITNESLIYWSMPDTLIAFPVILVGVVGLVIVTIGYDGAGILGIPHRIGYVALTAGALFGPVPVQVAAAALIVVAVYLSNRGLMPGPLSARPSEAEPTPSEQD